jgi:hypothetical protein
MTCPSNPPAPAGYRVWRSAVPTPLSQWAIDLRDHINGFPYGQTWSIDYGGKTAIARKDYHTWTYRNGQLITGLCIPGITLYEPLPQGMHAEFPGELTPDPSLAMYGADDVPQGTNWPLVAAAGGAIGVVSALFILAIRHARVAAASNPIARKRKRLTR